MSPRRTLHCLCLPLAILGSAVVPADPAPGEQWREVPMPPGFRVQLTELDGPVFADAAGRTLYSWPQHKLRNGYSGEAPGTPACYDAVSTVTAGLMSPYPPGIPLPELESRPSCTELWPPVLAGDGDEAVGDWSIVARRDGTLQWAYDEQPLYTSVRDRQPGDTFGGTTRKLNNDGPAGRRPVGPPALVPPGFAVATTSIGRMLTTDNDHAVYARRGESRDSIICAGDCLQLWEPLPAPALAQELGEWGVVERAPGVRQWVYRGQPLYRYRRDLRPWGQLGNDEPGWSNVLTQRAPPAPNEFTVQATLAGEVLADRRGRTIYIYNCGDDSADQLACDHPADTQVYRLAICGGGDPEICAQRWPYVDAAADAASDSRAWAPRWIDPVTGRFAAADTPGARRVWTYRDRPVYTYGLDERPGDVHGGGTGEWRGKRNGLLAFWLRDDYMEGIL